MIEDAASRELEIDVPNVSSKLLDGQIAVQIDYRIDRILSFRARIERLPDNSFKASVTGTSPTLFLRYV